MTLFEWLGGDIIYTEGEWRFGLTPSETMFFVGPFALLRMINYE